MVSPLYGDWIWCRDPIWGPGAYAGHVGPVLLLEGLEVPDGAGQQHLMEGADALGVLVAGIGESHDVVTHHGHIHDLVHQAGLGTVEGLGLLVVVDVYKRQQWGRQRRR